VRRRVPIAVAVVGVALLGLLGGDPRGTHDDSRSSAIVLAALFLALLVGTLGFTTGRRRPWPLVPVYLFLAVFGALSGWIAAVEILGDVGRAAQLTVEPMRAIILWAATSLAMALPPLGVAWLLGLGVTGPGTDRT
jgi:hypothetical protein